MSCWDLPGYRQCWNSSSAFCIHKPWLALSPVWKSFGVASGTSSGNREIYSFLHFVKIINLDASFGDSHFLYSCSLSVNAWNSNFQNWEWALEQCWQVPCVQICATTFQLRGRWRQGWIECIREQEIESSIFYSCVSRILYCRKHINLFLFILL